MATFQSLEDVFQSLELVWKGKTLLASLTSSIRFRDAVVDDDLILEVQTNVASPTLWKSASSY